MKYFAQGQQLGNGKTKNRHQFYPEHVGPLAKEKNIKSTMVPTQVTQWLPV
jgi:hypothetical protein